MSYLAITLHARTASFRDPETQNYHRTLPLPPPSTCLGLAGAALGLLGPGYDAFFAEAEGWELGTSGTTLGFARDLWKYDDFKEGAIVLRELLYDCTFRLVFGGPDEKVDQLRSAFIQPHFALSCGQSDSLCRVGEVERLSESRPLAPTDTLRGCYAGGDLTREVLERVSPGEKLKVRAANAYPVPRELPARFAYLTGGVRMTRSRILLSYVEELSTETPLNLRGIDYQGSFIPVFSV